MDAATAREIADALRRASAASSASGTAEHATLARRAAEKMKFDFPDVSVEEARALASRVRREDDDEGGWFTTTFARNCAEAVSGREDDAGGKGEEGERARAFRALFAAAYVHFPLRVARATDEEGVRMLEGFECPREDAEDAGGVGVEALAAALGSGGVATRVDDARLLVEEVSDDDWEPLETSKTWYDAKQRSIGDALAVNGSKRDLVNAKLRALMHELHPSRVGATTPDKGINCDWERLEIGCALMDLFETLTRDDDAERRALRTIPLRALRERWAVVASGKVGLDVGLTRVFDALKFGQDVADANEDQRIALELLGYLCLRFGADSMGVATAVADSEDAAARNKLWAHVHRSIPVIAKILENAMRVMDTEQCDPCWQDTVGLSALILTFYTTNASAAIYKDVSERMLRSGCLRALVNIFVCTYASSFAEAVRRALLLSTLACEGIFDYTSRVSSLHEALRQDAFRPSGSLASHGALWKVALREEDAHSYLAGIFDRCAADLDDEVNLAALRETLLLAQACERALPSSRSLFVRGGEPSAALKRMNVKVSEIIASMARSRDERLHAAKSHAEQDDDAKKNIDSPMAPDVEKRREVILEISRKLKDLLETSQGGGGIRKSD